MNAPGWRRLPLLLGAVLPAACDGTDIRAPAPEVGSALEAPAPDLPTAVLSAPVVLDLTRILAELEEAVPDRFGDLEERIDHPENDRVRVAFLARRSPFTTAMVGEEVRMSATVFLVGTPRLDQVAGVVQVPDLEFDIRTRNLLVGGLAWLAGGNLEAFLREWAEVPVEEILTLAEEQLHRGINRSLSDEVTVEGEVLGSDLLEVLADGPGLLVRASASVRAVLRIQQTEGPPPESSVVEPISPASPGG